MVINHRTVLFTHIMSDINNIFFELIRVAIGTQESLSRLPSAGEWGELYKMAKKQSLVGVCFAVRSLGTGSADLNYMNR